jgi:hypothetical protein
VPVRAVVRITACDDGRCGCAVFFLSNDTHVFEAILWSDGFDLIKVNFLPGMTDVERNGILETNKN